MTLSPTMRLRFALSVSAGTTPPDDCLVARGNGIDWATPRDVARSAKELVRTQRRISEASASEHRVRVAPPGTIILTRHQPVGGLAISTVDVCCSRDCLLLEPLPSADPGFFFYWLSAQTDLLQAIAGGSTTSELGVGDLLDLRVPCIEIRQQRAISRHLDRETAAIDALSDSQAKLLALLEERLLACRTEMVLRGVDPSASLYQSGEAWLDKIPAHWDVVQARWLFKRRRDSAPRGTSPWRHTPPRRQDAAFPHGLRTANGNGHDWVCRAGDLVIEFGFAKAGAMGVAQAEGMVGANSSVYAPGPRLLPGYVDEVVRTPTYVQEALRHCGTGPISRMRLPTEGFFDIRWPVPPLDEQRKIVKHTATEAKRISGPRASGERAVALLAERRVAVIALALDGQSDLRRVA